MARILVMDDDSQIRTALRETLERSGYDVVEAANGEVGIQMFCEKGADLIIADIIMPEKDGLSTIRALQEDSRNIKVVAISGGGDIEPRFYLKLAEESGALRTLTKPFQKNELLAVVTELLG
jgi:CheY-like chemotaxis protein